MARGSLGRCCAVSSLGGLGPDGFGAVLLREVLLGVCLVSGSFGDFVVHGACLFAGVLTRHRIGGFGWPADLLRLGP